MSIDSALYTRLSGFAGLAALVSTRNYPLIAPQNGTYPLVTYQQISGTRDYVMGNQSGLVMARFQLDSWAQDVPASARAVANQVRLALSNYHGTSDSVVIDYIELMNETVMGQPDEEFWRISQDYMVTFREALP